MPRDPLVGRQSNHYGFVRHESGGGFRGRPTRGLQCDLFRSAAQDSARDAERHAFNVEILKLQNSRSKREASRKYIAKQQLAFAGYATPEATLLSMTWAMLRGDYDKANEALSPEMLAGELRDQANDPALREKYEVARKTIEPLFKGVQLVARKSLSADRVELKIRIDQDPVPDGRPSPQFTVQPLERHGKVETERFNAGVQGRLGQKW